MVRHVTGSKTPSRRAFMMSVGAVALSGCSSGVMNFPMGQAAQDDLAEQDINVIRITPENILAHGETNGRSVTSVVTSPPRDPSAYRYLVGPGDELRVQTWSTPERRSLTESSIIPEGPIVNEKGEFFHPFVGMVRAAGKTVTEIQNDLENALVTYITDPQVEVDVREFRAHKVTLVGAVGSPGSTIVTDVPLRLLDIINQSGADDSSDLRRVEIRRKGTTYTVNLRAFIDYGTSGHNPILMPDDLVYVPAMGGNKVFLFGAVGAGEFALGAGKSTLTEVLASHGGIDSYRANSKGVFVFRRPLGQAKGFTVYQFDLSDAIALMLTSQFSMAPMDVVFVTTDPIAQWNDTVSKLISPVTGVVRARAVVQEL